MKLHCFVSLLSAFFAVTRLCDFLVCILWSCFLVMCSMFVVCFFIPFKKDQKMDTAKKGPNKIR